MNEFYNTSQQNNDLSTVQKKMTAANRKMSTIKLTSSMNLNLGAIKRGSLRNQSTKYVTDGFGIINDLN